MSSGTARATSWLTLLVLAALFQVLTRYAAAPHVDFVLDDWRYLVEAEQAVDTGAFLTAKLLQPRRPAKLFALAASFRVLGDSPRAFQFLSIAYATVILLFGALLVRLLTQRQHVALLFCVVFALLPNLTDNFLWATVSCGGYLYAAYVLSAVLWVLFLQGRRPLFFVTSVVAYAIAIMSNEIGVLLPLSFVVLLDRAEWKRAWMFLLPYGLVGGLYAVCMLTQGFGLASSVVASAPHFQPQFSWGPMLWNAREVASWWVGPRMWASVGHGVAAFQTLTPMRQVLLMAVSVPFVVGLGRYFVRLQKLSASCDRRGYSTSRILLFALAWVVLTHAPSLLAYTPARLNFLPGIGMAIGVAAGLACLPPRRWLSFTAPVVCVLLVANLGTAVSWGDAGQFNRRLYRSLEATRPDWDGKTHIFFDTESLRNRLTPGLLQASWRRPAAWARYGNAGLMRDISARAMVRRLSDSPPACIFEVENGAHVEGAILKWHTRYQPEAQHTTKRADVYVVDCLDAAVSAHARR